eukprot:6646113-Heterocapsa_arctica.AAC.1
MYSSHGPKRSFTDIHMPIITNFDTASYSLGNQNLFTDMLALRPMKHTFYLLKAQGRTIEGIRHRRINVESSRIGEASNTGRVDKYSNELDNSQIEKDKSWSNGKPWTSSKQTNFKYLVEGISQQR